MQPTDRHLAGRTRMDRGALLPAALLAGLLVLAFRGVFEGRLFYLRDVSQNHYPTRVFVTERLKTLSLPLWDPYHGAGTPLLADPNHLVLHPITALFFVLPLDAAFGAAIVLQFALLALGTYRLARALGLGREGSLLAAAVASLSGPAASLASLLNVLSGAAWVPAALCLLLRGLRPSRRRLLPIASLTLAAAVVALEPASLLGFVLLAPVLVLTAPQGGAPGRGARLLRLGEVAALASAIAAAPILAFRGLLPLTARGAGLAEGESVKWSLAPARLLEMVLPRLFGDPTHLSPAAWWGRGLFEGGYPFLLAVYLGPIVVVAVALALARRGAGAGRDRALAGIGALGLLLALGRHTPLYGALTAAAPVVRLVRYPERFVLVTLFAVALLAGSGLDRLLRGSPGYRRRAVGATFAVAGASFVALTVVAAWPAGIDRLLRAAASVPGELLASPDGAVIRGAVLRSSLQAFAETAILALGAVGALRARRPAAATLCGISLATASSLSMIVAGAPALSTAAPGWLKAASPLAPVVAHGPGAPRLHHDPRPDDLSVWATTDELAWGFRFDRFTYALATGHPDHVPTVLDAATDRMDLEGPVALGRELPGLAPAERVKVLAACGAGYLLTWAAIDDPGLEPGPALEGFSLPAARLYRIRDPLPRARLVGRARRPPVPGDLARSLADPTFDPAGEVLTEPDPRQDGAPAGSAGRVRVVDDEPERLVLEVDADRAAYLVVDDAWAPGWTARVDGAARPIQKADGLFRAVRVEPGRHRVTMDYMPGGLRAGLAVSLAALAAAAAWGGAAWRLRW